MVAECEGSEASDLVRLLKKDGSGMSDKAHGEMRNGHLIADSSHFVMGGLFGFAIAEAREVTFNFCTQIECALKKGGVPWNAGTGVIGDVEILGAAISLSFKGRGMLNWAAIRILLGNFHRSLDGASELKARA